MNYSSDPNGNQTGAGSRTFMYDLADRMKSTTSGSTTITYSYDGDGNRLEASSGPQPQDKTRSLWDRNTWLPLLVRESDGADALLRRYVHGADLISLRSGGGDYYYHYDPLGSVSNLTSGTGATQWTYGYEPFGTTRTEVQNDPSAPANRMKFSGELSDTAMGLYHLRAREYDPASGRFLRTDPLQDHVSNPLVGSYVYVGGRPNRACRSVGAKRLSH